MKIYIKGRIIKYMNVLKQYVRVVGFCEVISFVVVINWPEKTEMMYAI